MVNKLDSRGEKLKEKLEEKAKAKQEEEKTGVAETKQEEKPKKKVDIKKPKVSEIKGKGVYLPISPKTAVEVCRAISGQQVEKAKAILNYAIAIERPIRYFRYNRDTPHRKGKGFGAGRFPKKVSKYILGVLENAIANATYLNLDPEKLYIKTAVTQRAIPKQRGGRHANIEIVVAESKTEKKIEKKKAKVKNTESATPKVSEKAVN